MLNNFWYAVELSRNVTSKPQYVRLLSHDYVLFRGTEGQIIALDNQCAHRGAGLALGWTEGNCIRCPYHGWRYDVDGHCSHIPADAAGTPIPKRARVNAYSVQEKYGLVWLFVGDHNLPEAERPPIPSFPSFEAPERQPTYSQYTFDAHFTRTMENTLDVSHAPFMHKGSVGRSNPKDTVIEDYDLQVGDWGMEATLGIKINKFNGLMHYLLRDNPDAKKQYIFALPNITYSAVQFGNYRIESILAHIPVDNDTTVVKTVNIRSFLNHMPILSQWFDRKTSQVGDRICQEDNVVVKTQIPRVAPLNASSELLVASDATLIAYRKLLKKYAEQPETVDQMLTTV